MNIKISNRRRIWVFFPFILVVITIFLAVELGNISASVAANNVDTFYSTCGVPIIDGNVTNLEWSNAVSKSVLMYSPGAVPPFTATIHIMNSANYLYIGLTINDDEFTPLGNYLPEGDTSLFLFNNDNSGSLYELDNNILALSAGIPSYEDRYIFVTTPSNQEDILGGGTADGQGSTNRINELNHFELKFPLCSGDSLDFCLGSTQVVGFRLEYLDAETDESFGGSQYYPGMTEYSEADIVIGTCPNTLENFVYLPLIVK